ncbi:Acetyltransferase (GNAT) family protein [Chitinophaga eiseniae]|uniref:Acetyltransferase (GNAT) family protein n=1 Tax=Chitinophaga eiseniae TaxID=634771 RepID=A0A1T4SWQ6_9BACT|nr:GNAT family N-acetyltransferase [Chitinophaga eiseniae]SKA32694.1 Acetyltransferase (GNAT) family protein [Chitinophaga eiseniae]
MSSIRTYSHFAPPTKEQMDEVASFLFTHLGEFGDPLADIQNALNYALCLNGRTPGGLIITSSNDSVLNGVAVTNRTGMHGYIPDNILVYIATHREYRGQGIGRQLMIKAIQLSEGDMALHVEPSNPALRLYESLGFINKYLEMRLKK